MSKEEPSIIPIDLFNNKNIKKEQVINKEEDPMHWAEVYGTDTENFRIFSSSKSTKKEIK